MFKKFFSFNRKTTTLLLSILLLLSSLVGCQKEMNDSSETSGTTTAEINSAQSTIASEQEQQIEQTRTLAKNVLYHQKSTRPKQVLFYTPKSASESAASLDFSVKSRVMVFASPLFAHGKNFYKTCRVYYRKREERNQHTDKRR